MPGQSTELPVRPPNSALWRVCLLYAKHPKDQPGPKKYWGTYEVISEPVDEATMEKVNAQR